MRFYVNPTREFDRFVGEVERVANNIGDSFRSSKGNFSPRVDIYDNEETINLIVELPGVAKEDVKISVEETNTLVISGNKKNSMKQDENKPIRLERCFGDFSRSFLLPEFADFDNITAKFDNGMLFITIPRKQPVKKEKEIKIS